MPRHVLFLCTGNYYRSRLAEELFNHRAERLGLDWRATSRALAIERGAEENVGPISDHAIRALDKLLVPLRHPVRFPAAYRARFCAGEFDNSHEGGRTSPPGRNPIWRMGRAGNILARP
jgi:hypothetical protein